MEETTPAPIPKAHLIWEPPEREIAILLSLTVVDRLERIIKDSGETEIGGILLGHRETENESSQRRIVVIDDFEPIESEHLRGAAYALSPRDLKGLDAALARPRMPGDNVPVGFFRSHLRKGLYLDKADFSLFREYFSGNSDVFLVVRPEPDAAPVAGFFFWEGGSIERRVTYAQFPLDRQHLEGGGYPLLRDSMRPVEFLASMSGPPEKPPAPPPDDSRTKRVTYGTIGAVLILATLAWAAILRTPAKVAEDSNVSLSVDRTGKALRVSWDPNSPIVQRANNAILWISDGEKRRGLELNSDRLKQGSYSYTPESSVVNFRLDLLKVLGQGSESVRYVAGNPTQPQAALPVQKPAPTEPNIAAPESASENQDAKTAPPPPSPRTRSQPVVSIATQPLPPSRVRSWMSKVPLVRSLQRNHYRAGDGFVPPRTTREVMPHVPARLARDLPAEVRVDLKVSLNADGTVHEIDLLSPSVDERLAKIAADAVRQWRFEPARLYDKPVSCDLLATLNFRNSVPGSLVAQRE